MKYPKIILTLSFFTLTLVTFGQTIKHDKGKVINETFSNCFREPAQEVNDILILFARLG